MPLSAPRQTPARPAEVFHYPVKANTVIHQGALVTLDTNGWLVPGSVAATHKGVTFRAEESVANTGADGSVTCRVLRGCFRWNNSAAGDQITKADIGTTCYIVDDQTVAKTNGANTRSAAGVVRDVDAAGVWVES